MVSASVLTLALRDAIHWSVSPGRSRKPGVLPARYTPHADPQVASARGDEASDLLRMPFYLLVGL